MKIANVVAGIAGALLLGGCGGEEAPPPPTPQSKAVAQPVPSAPKPPSEADQASPAIVPPTAKDRERLTSTLAKKHPKATADQIECVVDGIATKLGIVRFVEIVGLNRAASDNPAAIAGRAELTAIQTGCDDGAATPNPACEFDDLIVWISPAVLLHRLVETRRLP